MARTWTTAEIGDYLLRTLRVLLWAGDELTDDSDLIASGLDSLTLAQLLLAVEEETGVWVDEQRLNPENLRTVYTLAACVYAQIASENGR